LAAALAGGGALAFAGVPAGWLSGAMIGVAALAAIGRAAPLVAPLQRLAIVLAGVGMGSGLTPATLGTLARYPATLALMMAAIGAMTAASYFVLVRARGFSRQTAFYSAVPGALSYVFIVAQPSGADMARLAVIQVFRIFVLMALVPIVASRVGFTGAPIRFLVDPLTTTVVLVAAAGWRAPLPSGSASLAARSMWRSSFPRWSMASAWRRDGSRRRSRSARRR
jgi:hypothetical protein